MKIERQFNKTAAFPVAVQQPIITTGGGASALGVKITFQADAEDGETVGQRNAHGHKIALHATPYEAAKLGRRLIAVSEPTRYTVTMRSTNGGGRLEFDTITIQPDQCAEDEAAAHAAGYGAVVVGLTPQNADTLRDMLRALLPHVHIADAGALYDEAREMVKP
jgi:hypothetical protein